MPKLMIYYNPDDNQVMTFNTHTPDSETGKDEQTRTGYVPATITKPALVNKLLGLGRNCKVVLTEVEDETIITDFTAHRNPVVPAAKVPREDPRDSQIAALEARIAALESV